MNTLANILKSKESIHGVKFDVQERNAIYKAMVQYGARQVAEFKTREIKGELPNFFKVIFSMTWDNWILYFRKIAFRKARKAAQLRADTEGYKIYCIRKSQIGYQNLSTLEVNINKKIRVLGKDVDAIQLERVSSFIAYPKKGTLGIRYENDEIKESIRTVLKRKQS